MINPVRWTGRCLSLVLLGVIVSACSHPPAPPSVATPSASVAVTSQPAVVPSKTATPNAIAQTAPALLSTTFQTQQGTTGFSTDGQYFIHLESWRDTGAGIPHAVLQVVNLPNNTCVAKGCLRTRFTESQSNQSIEAAEQDLLTKTQQLRQELNLTAPIAGAPLPVMTRSRATTNQTETMTVRLANNQPLQVTLKQKRVASVMSGGTADKDQASMQLEITYGGKTRSLGSLNQMHDGILEFAVREVQQSPDGKTVAILVTAAERTFEGTLGRTMVQGMAL